MTSALLCPHCGSGGAHEAGCPAVYPPLPPLELSCLTFWGSHGCSLPRGHADADVRHQCGLETDLDGTCSKVAWELDPLLGEERWVCRFANMAGDGWDAQAFPAVLFGEDVPEGTGGTQAQADRVRRIWEDAGKLARYVNGRGWVYQAKEQA